MENDENIIERPTEKKAEEPDDKFLPKKDLFRIDEVAQYFDVSPGTVRTLIAHKHFDTEMVRQQVRITRPSIMRYRKRQRR